MEAIAVSEAAVPGPCTPSAPPVSLADLATAPLFRDVEIGTLLPMLQQCPVRTLQRGAVLLERGDVSTEVYLVLEGAIEIRVDLLDEHPIHTARAGETVGELALVDASGRAACAVAASACRVLELSPDVFWSLVHSSHEVAVNLLHLLAVRMRGNIATIEEGRRLQTLYKRHASIDALTGLHNRRWLDEMLPRQARRGELQGEPLSVLMMDIDHFKTFNDTWGHSTGDFVLFAVAQILQSRLRPTDMLVRYGGEELVAILPRTDLPGARVAAERLRRAVAFTPMVRPDGVELPNVTLSIGVAEHQPSAAVIELLAQADRALYAAKHAGRNQVVG